jgi:transposase
LALATVLQAYVGCSDDEVIEATTMDRRWQLVLDCLDASRPPFSKGTLVAFRQRLIDQTADRRLIERTVELAAQRGGFGSRALRAALDSSPLWGDGRVEDTYNLLGHALRKALGVLARQQGRGLADVATEAGAPILGGPSLKAALDLDWDDPTERTRALVAVLDALGAVERYLDQQTADDETAARRTALAVARQVREQDVEPAADGTLAVRRGVAQDRRISIEDAEMRHGRKSRSHRFDGYKRHVLRDLDAGVIRAVGITAANVPEASVTEAIIADLGHQAARLDELHIDRAYLSSTLVRERPADLSIFCKAWPVRNGDRFPKTAFALDWEQQTIRCPNGALLPFAPGGTVRFPAPTCAACPLRDRCTTSTHGRSVTIHPDERLLVELRRRQVTPAGRAKLRERVAVEHTLAHIGRWQGRRARYRGARKNLFDLRRCAVVHNLHVLARPPQPNAA